MFWRSLGCMSIWNNVLKVVVFQHKTDLRSVTPQSLWPWWLIGWQRLLGPPAMWQLHWRFKSRFSRHQLPYDHHDLGDREPTDMVHIFYIVLLLPIKNLELSSACYDVLLLCVVSLRLCRRSAVWFHFMFTRGSRHTIILRLCKLPNRRCIFIVVVF